MPDHPKMRAKSRNGLCANRYRRAIVNSDDFIILRRNILLIGRTQRVKRPRIFASHIVENHHDREVHDV